MSLTINLNFCQKACVSVPPSTCLIPPLTWASQNNNVANVFGNNENAIIRAVYGAIGTAFITLSDAAGVVVAIYVNVSAYSDPVVNAKYQYVYSFNVSGVSGIGGSQTLGTISGPYTSVIIPFQTDVVPIYMPQTSGGSIYPNACVFVPGSPPLVQITGKFPTGQSFLSGLALFKPTINPLIDSKLIFAQTVTSGNAAASYVINGFNMKESFYFTNYVTYCDPSNYTVIAIPSVLASSTTGPFVTGAKLFPGGAIGIQTQGLSIPSQFNIIVVPSAIYDLSSNDLVYSKIVTGFNDGFNIFPIDPIPFGSVVWFVQQQGYDDTTIVQVYGVDQPSSTLLFVFIDAFGTTSNKSLALLAYRAQSNVGWSVSFP